MEINIKILFVFIVIIIKTSLIAQNNNLTEETLNKELDSLFTITGKVISKKDEGISFANVIMYYDNEIIKGCSSDINGNYKLTIEPYKTFKLYTLVASLVGHHSHEIKDVNICKRTIYLDFILTEKKHFKETQIITITKRTIDKDPANANKTTIKREEIQRSASGR